MNTNACSSQLPGQHYKHYEQSIFLVQSCFDSYFVVVNMIALSNIDTLTILPIGSSPSDCGMEWYVGFLWLWNGMKYWALDEYIVAAIVSKKHFVYSKKNIQNDSKYSKLIKFQNSPLLYTSIDKIIIIYMYRKIH